MMAELPNELPDLSSRLKSANVTESVDLGSYDDENSQLQLLVPIVGYEVMEERARFTVFKLRIENLGSSDMWFVYRRYTDFFRLYSKLRGMFPGVKLPLPRKRWFGDNFDPTFLDERVVGLQNFINSLLSHEELLKAQCTRDFFCLDDPPSYTDSVEETRAMLDAMEDTIFQLKHQLKERESDIDRLKEEISVESRHKEHLFSLIQEAIQDCPQCSKEFARINHLENPECSQEEDPSEVLKAVESENVELTNIDQ